MKNSGIENMQKHFNSLNLFYKFKCIPIIYLKLVHKNRKAIWMNKKSEIWGFVKCY